MNAIRHTSVNAVRDLAAIDTHRSLYRTPAPDSKNVLTNRHTVKETPFPTSRRLEFFSVLKRTLFLSRSMIVD